MRFFLGSWTGIFLPNHRQLYDGFSSLCHVLTTDPFQLAVKILHTSENIGTGHAHITELAAIRTTSDAFDFNRQTNALDRFFCIGHYLRKLVQHFFHIAVLFHNWPTLLLLFVSI